MKSSPPAVAELVADAERVFADAWGRDRVERLGLGRRARSLVTRRAGKYARHRVSAPGAADVALDATVRACALRIAPALPLRVEPGDIRWRIREHRCPLDVVLVVDNSYSLRAERVVEEAKGLAFRLLENGIRKGDRLGLVAFRGGLPEATVALPLTRSRTLARERLRRIPLSGRTPLADAFRRGRVLLRQQFRRQGKAVALLVAITDGLPTAPLRPGGDAVGDALAQARAVARAGIRCVIADAAPAGSAAAADSWARALAETSGGRYLRVDELIAQTGSQEGAR